MRCRSINLSKLNQDSLPDTPKRYRHNHRDAIGEYTKTLPTPIKPFSANHMPMDTIDSYFPYAEYRPGQRHMLEVAARGAREGGITLIDAPTGQRKVERGGISSC